MLKALIVAGLLAIGGTAPALAQTANATSPSATPGGPNQAQQAPSGGTVTPNGDAAGGTGQSKIGAPTEAEQRAQKDSKKATEICKGC